MWPWEHLAVGYVLYSLYTHARGDGSPRTGPVLVLLFATQFPDLVDKPLAWIFGVLPSGRSLAHSLLVATPTLLVVSVAALLVRAPRAVPAFTLGYLSHLATDVAYPLVVKGDLRVGFLLWPIVPAADTGSPPGIDHVRELVMEFVAFVLTPRGMMYLTFDVGLVVGTLLLWVYDGMPGVRPLIDATVPRGRPERE